jgi:thymidylate synthase (FAD)
LSNDIVEPSVELIGWTAFRAPDSTVWVPEPGQEPIEGGQHLAEFAGRACYQSWSRPNTATATNEGYIEHILDVGHYSVLEHGTASFYIAGVSRSLTHELVRHRHFSYSQLSQRYVDSKDAGIVVPPELTDNHEAIDILQQHMADSVVAYERLVALMKADLEASGISGTEARKRARQAARAVMPNMTETRLVVSGNHRAWRHFIDKRAHPAADVEIRRVACLILDQLVDAVPNIYQDFSYEKLEDGTYAATREGADHDG